MMRLPIVFIEGKKFQRAVLSIRLSIPPEDIFSIMKMAYDLGAWCFDLPSPRHLESFRELKYRTGDETLIGLCHLEAEKGTSFMGRPLHRFESKVITTIRKNVVPPNLARNLFPSSSSSPAEVFTQKEIDRISFDPARFDQALSPLNPEESPFLFIGERYGDWLLALGRIDLLKEMIFKVREKGLIPIFSGQWATLVLPKAKSLDVAAYAVPINKKWSFFDLPQACNLIKKFDRSVISLNPFADGKLLKKPGEALSFLFQELKIQAAVAEVASGEDVKMILEAMEAFPSLIPHRKT